MDWLMGLSLPAYEAWQVLGGAAGLLIAALAIQGARSPNFRKDWREISLKLKPGLNTPKGQGQ